MHAYLIVTNEDRVNVRDFLQNVNEPIIEHHYLKIKIDDVRELNSLLLTRGTESHVIYFDNFLDVAQNAFLKTLEEPSFEKQIFLVSKSKSNLLDTLLSRITVFEREKVIDPKLDQKFLKQSIPERLDEIKKILDFNHDDVRPSAQKFIEQLISAKGLTAQQKQTLAQMHDFLYAQGSSAKQILEFIATTI